MSGEERREVIERAAAEVFAQRGYHGASIDEICRRSGVTAPVLYDHFGSKLALRLADRRVHGICDEPADVRIPRAVDAWAAYMQEHPYAPRMFFADTTGDPEIEAIHRQVAAQGTIALGAIVGGEPGAPHLGDSRAHEMAAALMRGALAGLAIWWSDHPEVPREEVVKAALNVIWVGLERVRRGETWG